MRVRRWVVCGVVSLAVVCGAYSEVGASEIDARSDEELRLARESLGIEDVDVALDRDVPGGESARQLGGGSFDLLLVPDSDADRVMAFDPFTGDLVDPDFIPSDSLNLAIPVEVILSSSGDSLLVSDQSNDVVHEYDFLGQYIGVFAPAGGRDTAILDNVRGIDLRPNGHLLVTVASGSNADSIAEFDTAGTYLGNFVEIGEGGLADPWDVLVIPPGPGAGVYVPADDNDAVLRFDLLNGAYLGDFAAINSFPQQISETAQGTFLVAVFSGSDGDVVELAQDGTPVAMYAVFEVTGARGVAELGNGNILVSGSSGVFEFDRTGALVETEITGVNGRFVSRVAIRDDLSLTIFGDCPGDATISVTGGAPGGPVAVLRGSGVGNDTFSGGGCGALQTGLSDPVFQGRLRLDENGLAVLDTPTSGEGCGLPVQAVDASTCELSNVEFLP